MADIDEYREATRRDMETQERLLEMIDTLRGTVRAGVTIKNWEEQKWVAAVDEYNECRYDCEPARLMAA